MAPSIQLALPPPVLNVRAALGLIVRLPVICGEPPQLSIVVALPVTTMALPNEINAWMSPPLSVSVPADDDPKAFALFM